MYRYLLDIVFCQSFLCAAVPSCPRGEQGKWGFASSHGSKCVGLDFFCEELPYLLSAERALWEGENPDVYIDVSILSCWLYNNVPFCGLVVRIKYILEEALDGSRREYLFLLRFLIRIAVLFLFFLLSVVYS